jgi:PAS domain S-box-containing protein
MQKKTIGNVSTVAFMKQFEHHVAMMFLISYGDGRIVEANPAAVRFYGYTHDALCSLRITEVNELPPADLAQDVAAAFRQERNHFVSSHRLASGEIRTVHQSCRD